MNRYMSTTVTSDVCGGVDPQTLNRMVKEDGFPKPKQTGRNNYYKESEVFEWLTDKAGEPVDVSDRFLSSKTLEAIFKRSSAWVWQKMQKDKARKAKAVYFRSRPYWRESFIYSDPELRKYLDIVEGAI